MYDIIRQISKGAFAYFMAINEYKNYGEQQKLQMIASAMYKFYRYTNKFCCSKPNHVFLLQRLLMLSLVIYLNIEFYYMI